MGIQAAALVAWVLGTAVDPAAARTSLHAAPGPVAVSCDSSSARLLEPAGPAVVETVEEETDCWALRLDRGDYARIVVEEETGEVVVAVLPPGASEPTQRVFRYWTKGFEQVGVTANETGTHVLQVTRLRGDEPAAYTIRVATRLSAEEQRSSRSRLADDPRARWIAEHAIRLRSISPVDTAFDDLEPLRAILDGVDVVMLGEQSHGDGTANLARSRLVRFLHQEMGFDVLAFESGMYDAWRAWRAADAAGSAQARADTLRSGISTVWSTSRDALFTYMAAERDGPRPLELAGFDEQLSGTAARTAFLADLEWALDRLGVSMKPLAPGTTAREMFTKYVAGSHYREGSGPTEPWEQTDDALGILAAELRGRLDELEADHARLAGFWTRVLEDARSRLSRDLEYLRDGDMSSLVAVRDARMADNLLWMVREFYAGRKIIVWAHNAHIMKNLGSISTSRSDSYEGMEMMGDHVWRELGDHVYILGATSYQGRFLRAGLDRLPNHIVRDQHESVELEELLDAAAPDHAVLDLRRRGPEGAWLDQPIMARLMEHVSERAVWSAVVDGLLFNREMRPRTARPD